MLRTYGYGNERDFRWQDYLENDVNEATSKRKGENEATLTENSIENHFDPQFFLIFLRMFVDVYGNCHPSFRWAEKSCSLRNAQTDCRVSWFLRGLGLHLHPS